MKKNFGFTLAEVLITLGIIGVISAITMPILITNYQKQVTVNKLKQTYSMLSQAIQMAEAEYGFMSEWDIDYNETDKFFNKYMKPYLKTTDANLNPVKHFFLNGIDFDNDFVPGTLKHYYLANGSELAMWGSPPYNVFFIFVDINGYKLPNVVGKDTFLFNTDIDKGIVANGSLLDRDTMINSEWSGCNKSSRGNFCGALIMHDGWKIEKDYPW